MSGINETPSGDIVVTTTNGQNYYATGDLANCTLPACPVELSTYGYRASLPLSVILIVIYLGCAGYQGHLGWRYKTWGFMTAMLLGCLTEIIGYVGRILMWQNPFGSTGFAIQIGISITQTLE
ncbi:hypothetical protein ANO11243_084960 [Dothideomycetidae sp. 11243]|nr:hypothetical protein ANO11243_084960 [fungal sp. No.11243]